MSQRHIILTGAPVPSSLCWEEDELETASSKTHHAADEARWRSLGRVRETTVLTAPIDEGEWFFTAGAVQRYSGESVSGLETTALSAFYEQSFALHEGISSGSFNDDTRSLGDDDSTTGLIDSPEGDASSLLPTGSQLRSTVRSHLSDLEDIPKAAYVNGLAPRVVTVNLIVAVITVEQRRRVRTRWGRAIDLVELLVGDETKSGFRISCWLPPRDDLHQHQQQTKQSPLEESLEEVRPCDIVLLRSVALGTFRGQVYGQSLRNNLTSLDLLHRRRVDGMDSEGPYPGRRLDGPATDSHDPQMAKVARVRSWMLDFIGPAREQVNQLPPDTQG
ncbi:hypothetical protein A7D00_6286 [Trichophyton violaceum]|uniref:Uncharacterized protein n=1 Tax=Trichophyton violaceum TaxID=34388 RepID=A0A178FDE7_TRIVO|nr:hypothetical protein A7D00_6286 [Trichophyton violaceum]